MLASKKKQQESRMHMQQRGIKVKPSLAIPIIKSLLRLHNSQFLETLFRLHFALSSFAINSFLFSSFPRSKAQNLLRFKASEPNK